MPDLKDLDTGAVAIKLLYQEKANMDDKLLQDAFRLAVEEMVRKEETMDDKLMQDAFMFAVEGKEDRCRTIIRVMSKTEWLKIILGCAKLSQLVYVEGMNLMQQALDNINDEVDLLLEEMEKGMIKDMNGECEGR